jgi:hypothetical protein
VNGPHLLFTAAFPPAFSSVSRLLADWSGPACWQLGTGGEYAAVAGALAQLRAEYDRPPGTVSRDILQFLLATLMLHINRLPYPGGRDPRLALVAILVSARHRQASQRSAAPSQ